MENVDFINPDGTDYCNFIWVDGHNVCEFMLVISKNMVTSCGIPSTINYNETCKYYD